VTPPDTLTLGDAVEKWLGQHIKATRITYGYDTNQLLGVLGPERPLALVTPHLIDDFVSYLNSPDLNYAPKTVNKKIKTLRTFFNWCVKRGYLESSPATGTKYHRTSEYVGREKAATDEEYMRLKAHFENPVWQWRDPVIRFRNLALLHFLADTGCRISEAARLQVTQINWHTCEAQVLGKGQKMRPVWFGNDCYQALRYWLIVRPDEACQHVFTKYDTPPSTDGLRVMLWRASKAVLKRNVSPHMFRHRKAFTLFDMGVAPTHVATVLGDTVEIVIRYYCPTDFNSARAASLQMIQRDEKLVVLPQHKSAT